jgi:hypothetical protein
MEQNYSHKNLDEIKNSTLKTQFLKQVIRIRDMIDYLFVDEKEIDFNKLGLTRYIEEFKEWINEHDDINIVEYLFKDQLTSLEIITNFEKKILKHTYVKPLP